MSVITAKKITEAVRQACLEANFKLRQDVSAALSRAYARETSRKAKTLLKAIIDNASVAKKESLAICQDTGMPIVFLEVGQQARIQGDLAAAVNKGVAQGYAQGSLRESIVQEPLLRGKSGYVPVIIHTDLVAGSKVKITVLPKGFGCENKSQLKMFRPTVQAEEVMRFIVDAVKAAGPDACPPYVVGVGIGGTADYAALLAKKALLKKISPSPKGMEKELLRRMNALHIGPMGLGGKCTALAAHVETFPTHIAGLPVAVNISCHALRSATRTIA